MLNDLRKYENLGTPNYYFQLFKAIESSNTNWVIDDLKQLFFNKIVDGRSVFDGCIELAIKIDLIIIEQEFVKLAPDISSGLNNEKQMCDRFAQLLFKALKNDEIFFDIFKSEHLSFDVIYRSLQISNIAFGFKFSSFKQLLLDFNFIQEHPTPQIGNYIINNRYRKLLDKIILPEIKKRKIGIDELKRSMEQKSINGGEAESFVFDFEHKRLEETKEIDWVSEYVANVGYDIASFNSVSDIDYSRFIEVKSYEGNKPYFFWSRNEYLVAKRKKNKYWLYLVNRKEMNNPEYQPIMVQNPFDQILNNDNEWFKQIEKYRIEMS